MNTFDLKLGKRDVALFLAPHADDVEIGCGGILLRLKEANLGERHCVLFTGTPERCKEARQSAKAFGMKFKKRGPYDDRFLPVKWPNVLEDLIALREKFHRERKTIAVIFCTRIDDRHQDHQVIGENVRRVFRDHLILEYETPNYDGNMAKPNLYLHVEDRLAQEKARLICDVFKGRKRVHRWWSKETLLSLMTIRGIESNFTFAEGFVAPKVVGRFVGQ